jgi:hypothetical protein
VTALRKQYPAEAAEVLNVVNDGIGAPLKDNWNARL